MVVGGSLRRSRPNCERALRGTFKTNIHVGQAPSANRQTNSNNGCKKLVDVMNTIGPGSTCKSVSCTKGKSGRGGAGGQSGTPHVRTTDMFYLWPLGGGVGIELSFMERNVHWAKSPPLLMVWSRDGQGLTGTRGG